MYRYRCANVLPLTFLNPSSLRCYYYHCCYSSFVPRPMVQNTQRSPFHAPVAPVALHVSDYCYIYLNFPPTNTSHKNLLHVMKCCLVQEFESVVKNEARRVHELDVLCSIFSDEGKVVDSRVLRIQFKGFVVFREA